MNKRLFTQATDSEGFLPLFMVWRVARGDYAASPCREAAMETKALDQVLTQLRAAAARAGLNNGPTVAAGAAANPTDFAALLRSSLEHVNTRQQQAVQLARDFEFGAPGANLPEVTVAIQKANVSFQQAVQVRNRLVSAYHDIMNMQV